MKRLKTLDGVDLRGRRVLMRVDFNVPVEGGRVVDDTRIRAHLPTVEEIMGKGASRLILMSHLGRPKGGFDERYSLKPVAERLRELGHEVHLAPPVFDDGLRAWAGGLPEGALGMLENVRFHPGEEANDATLSALYASLGDVFVNDAFGSAHRAHASTVGVAGLLPSFAGRLMQREVEALSRVKESPERPFAVVLGGAKVSDKLSVIRNLLKVADVLLVGGGMAFTFLRARGHGVGKSLCEDSLLGEVSSLMGLYGDRIVLPVDVVVADSPDSPSGEVVSVEGIPEGKMGLDVGPKTLELFAGRLKGARTVFWNGPMGVFERKPFARGTLEMARLLSSSPAFVVVGGGDTVAAINELGVEGSFGHISTGGGASLEFFEKEVLPGVEPLLEG